MSDQRTIRIMCVDDHAFLIEGLRARIVATPGLEFVGAVRTLEGIHAEIAAMRPDVILLDLELPGPDVFQTITEIKQRKPEVRVVVLSAHVRDRFIDAAVKAGAAGYFTKAEDPGTILDGVLRAARGEYAFSAEIVQRMYEAQSPAKSADAPAPASRLGTLTPREQQILRMIGRGQTRTEIAQVIHRSPKTVDAHRASIMEKLGIHDRVELARYAIREGLVEI